MKIEELFDMPIHEMRDWMRDNFKNIEPEVHYENAYFDFFKSFGLEKSNNWRNMPITATDWCVGNRGSILDRMKDSWNELYFAVAKISKYGECLVYVFVGNWYYDGDERSAHYHDPRHLEIDKIYCNDKNGNVKCHCFAEGPDVVNKSRLCVYEDEGNTSQRHDSSYKWFKAFPWLDMHPSVFFKTLPTIGGIKKNKHTINEYNEKLENFAKKVMESSVHFNELLKALNDKEDIVNEKCKSVKIDRKYVMELWRALLVENDNVTLDDVIGIIKLVQSEQQLIIDYVESCKGESIRYDTYDKKWEIVKDFYGPYPYRFCKLYDNKSYIDTPKYLGFVKDLDATRKLYMSLDTYKDTIKEAKEHYQISFKNIAEKFEQNVTVAYNLAINQLMLAKDTYLKDVKELYNQVHDTFPGVNDSDVGIFEDMPDIIEKLKNEFNNTSKRVMRQLKPNYGYNEKKEKKESNGFSKEFMEHAKLFFDVVSDVDKIPFFAEGKACDAPYEQTSRDPEVEEHIGDEAIYEFEEKFGQGSFEVWLDKFFDLCPSYNVDCDDCYPGWTRFYFITRNMEEVCDEED